MADDKKVAEPQQEAQDSQPRNRSKRLFLLLPVILMLGAAGFVGWTYMNGRLTSTIQEGPAPPPPPESPAPTVSLKPFVVNLVEDGDVPRYLKIEFDLELRRGSPVEEVEAKMAELRDAIIVLLSSKRPKDLITIEGKDRLRDEIITRVNSRLQAATATRVFFKQFIIQ